MARTPFSLVHVLLTHRRIFHTLHPIVFSPVPSILCYGPSGQVRELGGRPIVQCGSDIRYYRFELNGGIRLKPCIRLFDDLDQRYQRL